MIRLNYEFVNDNGEWEKCGSNCEDMHEANLKIKAILRSDRFRNPNIEEVEKWIYSKSY